MFKDAQKMIIVMLASFLVASITGNVLQVNGENSLTDNVKQVIEQTIDESVDRAVKENMGSMYDQSVYLLEESFAECRTEDDIVKKIEYFNDKGFLSQVAAMRVIAENDIAYKRLECALYKPEFAHIIAISYK